MRKSQSTNASEKGKFNKGLDKEGARQLNPSGIVNLNQALATSHVQEEIQPENCPVLSTNRNPEHDMENQHCTESSAKSNRSNPKAPPPCPQNALSDQDDPSLLSWKQTSHEGKPRLRWEVGALYPLIPGRLSFAAHKDDDQTVQEIRLHRKLYFFSTDLQEQYAPLCADFGPVNLGTLTRFCDYVHEKVTHKRLQNRHLVYYCTNEPDVVTNTAFLLSAYLILKHGFTAEAAVEPFQMIHKSPIFPFRDATWSDSTFDLSILDCVRGLKRAVELDWFNIDTFDLEGYEELEDPLNGDMHQVCPKFIAFRGPDQRNPRPEEGAHSPTLHVTTFKKLGVSTVVRLNNKETYDKRVFEGEGFKHIDLYFDDCTTPSDAIVAQFLEAAEQPGLFAVHCLAGLGRTGSLIALWMMKNYQFSAREAIGWLRIVRPGCVIGPQQHYLEVMEQRLREGTFPDSSVTLFGSNARTSKHFLPSISRQLAEQVTTGIASRATARRTRSSKF